MRKHSRCGHKSPRQRGEPPQGANPNKDTINQLVSASTVKEQLADNNLLDCSLQIPTTTAKDNIVSSPLTDPNYLSMLWKMRLHDFWLTVSLCILLIGAVITASAITFCITKSPLSFSYLSFLALLFRLRRRIESFLYPLSKGDLTLELARIQAKAKEQEGLTDRILTSWLYHRQGRLNWGNLSEGGEDPGKPSRT